MELFNGPTEFEEAVKQLQARKLLPTNLSSAQLRQLRGEFLRLSMFSARTVNQNLLAKYKDVVESIINPQQVLRPGATQTTTEGLNPAKAAEIVQTFLRKAGYSPDSDKRGSIQDLSSLARINLVVKTNSDLSWGAGNFVQQNSNPTRVQDYPALELYRQMAKKVPRDWEERWSAAADASGDDDAAHALDSGGRMIALKSSGIWQALGDGAGGYDDTLGNPYPPFAFESGMWTRDVSRAEAAKLGLLDQDEEAKPAAFDFASLFNLKEAA